MSDIDVILPDDLSGLNEKRFQAVVVEVAGILGYTATYHTTFSLGSESGFPDLALFNPTQGGAVFLEVKAGKNRPTAKQRMWLYDLRCAGFHAYVAHASWIEVIVDVLKGRYPPPVVGVGEPHPVLRDICFPPEFIKE